MSDNTTSFNKPVILPYQKPIFDRLSTIARACLYVDRKSIGALKLRANFLLLGTTGTGKTFLAKEIARELKVPFLAVAVSDWIILGGNTRGSSVTWPTIVDFIRKNKNKKGAIIFIDELDKCYHDSNWNSFLRSEIFILPSPSKDDYRSMIEIMAENISDLWRKSFLEIGMSRLDQAVRDKKGARYPEEVLLAAIVAERSCMENWKPECEEAEAAPDEPDDPEKG